VKVTEGIVWEKKGDQWVKTLDAWPEGRRGARIFANNDSPFGQYGKNEAIKMIEEWILNKNLSNYDRLGVVPGKEMTEESKEKLKNFTTKKKIERGEAEPVESYISKEEE
jgi:hypothetical protein